MIVGIPKESFPGERRVALVPAVIPSLVKVGFEVVVEAGAGAAAGYPDAEYTGKGGKILPQRAEVFKAADVVLQVLCYGSNDVTGKADMPLLRRGQVLIGFLRPLGSVETVQEIAAAGVSAFSIEFMPRSTRAQSMDALSSMATICGYKAVLLAADRLPRLFPMLTTAAGTITPARVFIIGAGVAGLRRLPRRAGLGAVASAYDMRPAAKEQVQSLGGRFVELPVEAKDAQDARGYARAQDESFYQRQRELLGRVVAESDVVITAAVIPGKKAPRARYARHGGEDGARLGHRGRGGRAGRKLRTHSGRPRSLSSTMLPSSAISTWRVRVPYHASQMYSRNVAAVSPHLTKDRKIVIDSSDEITRETLVTQGGKVVNTRVREFLGWRESSRQTDTVSHGMEGRGGSMRGSREFFCPPRVGQALPRF